MIDITFDLFNPEDRYSPWNTTVSPYIYNPVNIWDRACACPNVTLARHRSLNLRPESDNRYSTTRCFYCSVIPLPDYVSNNRIYVGSHLFAGTDSIAIDLMTMEDWLFSQHRTPTILPFLLVGCCDCRWLRNDLSIPRAPDYMSYKKSLQFISTFGCNGTLPLAYLGPVAVFQQNINLRGAAQTSSPNIAHSSWMHESDAWHTLKCDIYEFNRVRIRHSRYTSFQ